MGFESQCHKVRIAGREELESLLKRVCSGMRLIKCSSLVALGSKGNLKGAARIAISMSPELSFPTRLARICFVDRGLATCYM
jgi:hypothetical protein